MKKIYEKPAVVFERFMANVAVASGCDRLEAGTYYPSVRVDCVVTTYDVIFTDKANGCEHVINPDGADNYKFITYNGTLYFAWIGPSGGGGQGGDMNLLQNILRAGGINSVQADGKNVWHAGPAEKELLTIYSHSY